MPGVAVHQGDPAVSLTQQHTVWCDGGQCVRWFQSSGPAAVVLREAVRHGWTVRKPHGGKVLHLCPACSR